MLQNNFGLICRLVLTKKKKRVTSRQKLSSASALHAASGMSSRRCFNVLERLPIVISQSELLLARRNSGPLRLRSRSACPTGRYAHHNPETQNVRAQQRITRPTRNCGKGFLYSGSLCPTPFLMTKAGGRFLHYEEWRWRFVSRITRCRGPSSNRLRDIGKTAINYTF